MSDVVVSVTESTTAVTVSEQDVAVAITENPVTVSASSVGLQGIPGTNGTNGSDATITAGTASVLASTALPTVTNTGTSSAAIFNFGIPSGSAGTNGTNGTNGTSATITVGTTSVLASTALPTVTNTGTSSAAIFNFGIPAGSAGTNGTNGTSGISGVISVVAPITNTGTSSSAILGLDQTALNILRSQVSNFTSGTVASATLAGTATYATTSGTSVSISGSITKSQISDFTSGTVANISGTVAATQVTGTAIVVGSSALVPTGGTAGQVLSKVDSTNYNLAWSTPSSGSGAFTAYFGSTAVWAPDFTTTATAKSCLGGNTVGYTVSADSTYEFEFQLYIQGSYITGPSQTPTVHIGSTTVTLSPTVTVNYYAGSSSSTTSYAAGAATSWGHPATVGWTSPIALSTGTRYFTFIGKGQIRITGTGTTKIYPTLAMSVTSADNVWQVATGSSFKLTYLGNGTVSTVGTFA